MSDEKKIELIFFGDVPKTHQGGSETGFGKVSGNILKRLHATGKYNITVVGINYLGDPHDLPYRIYPAVNNTQGDVYGRQVLLNLLMKNDYDILFTLQDTFIMASFGEQIKKIRDGRIEEKDGKKVLIKGKNFKWIYYYPIDATPQKEWIEKSVKYVDVAVPYTKYAERESKKFLDRKYDVIYHGFDKKDFYVMSEKSKQEFRDKYFKDHDLEKKFFLVNVNRNQERKGYLQTLVSFKLLHNIYPNTVLYTHCDVANDRGGNLIEVGKQLGITENWIYPNPDAFKNKVEFPVEYINGLYNIADANISTSLGEGFGLSLIEAMATKTINVFPDNTAISELLADGKGILVDCGKNPNHLVTNGHLDNNLLRPTVDVMDVVKKLLWVYQKPEEVKKITDKAYEFAIKEMNWDKIAEEFNQLILKMYDKKS